MSQVVDKEHLLKETETTMKFGLFSMVQQYLHAMRLVQREKMAWSGEGDAIGKDVDAQFRTPLTSERKKMVQVRSLGRETTIGRRRERGVDWLRGGLIPPHRDSGCFLVSCALLAYVVLLARMTYRVNLDLLRDQAAIPLSTFLSNGHFRQGKFE